MLGKYTTLVLHTSILCYYLIAMKEHSDMGKNLKNPEKYEVLKVLKQFRHNFFTGWNFGLQTFLITISILNELANICSFVQTSKILNRIRSYVFNALVFPCTLLVMLIFWGVFLIDRNLIFPPNLDDFYPKWLNHTVHSFIIVPLIIEILSKKSNNFIKWWSAALGLTLYLLAYQIQLTAIYLKHEVWLYPIYNRFSVGQNIVFTLTVYGIGLGFLSTGIYLQNLKKTRRTLEKKVH